MSSRTRSNYRDTEVRALVEDYEELRELRDTKPGAPLRALLTLADIDREYSRLPHKERQALLMVGKAGLTTRTAGVLVGVSAMSMSRRYQSGMERLVTYMNGAYGE